MEAPPFPELVSRLIEAMGQQLGAMRQRPEGLLLRTGDGFLYVFLEKPENVSLAHVQGFLREAGTHPNQLVAFTPGHLPLALAGEFLRAGATVVEGSRFHELVRSLDLAQYLGEEPRAERPPSSERALPSARQLGEVLQRARTWQDWGVPALALRFYRQAVTMKPEFAPAQAGIGRALLSLGLTDEAARTFEEILAQHPEDVEARLGRAAVRGRKDDLEGELSEYRALLAEDAGRLDVRAHLAAALVEHGRWAEARTEVETMLRSAPEDPRLRFLHAVTLERTGATGESASERDRARTLGLTYEAEKALCLQLGLTPPTAPAPVGAPAPAPTPAPPGAAPSPRPQAAPGGPRARRPKARVRRARPPSAKPRSVRKRK